METGTHAECLVLSSLFRGNLCERLHLRGPGTATAPDQGTTPNATRRTRSPTCARAW